MLKSWGITIQFFATTMAVKFVVYANNAPPLIPILLAGVLHPFNEPPDGVWQTKYAPNCILCSNLLSLAYYVYCAKKSPTTLASATR